MLYPRLYLAKMLLKDDGVIFCSIDDRNQAYVKCLFDEVFGERNFIGDFIRKTKSTTNDTKTGVNYQHEFLFCYAKDKEFTNLLGGQKDLSKYKNPDNDPNGEWVSSDPSAKRQTKTGYFSIVNPYTGKEDYPPKGMDWRFSKNTLQKHIDEGRICFKKEHKENERGFIYKRYLKDLKTDLKTFDSLKFISNEFMNQAATKELLSLGLGEAFKYPKGVDFIKEILRHSTNARAGDSESVEEACHSEGARSGGEESLYESLVAKRDSSPLAGVQNDKNANSNSSVVSTPARGDNESGISNRDSSLVSQAQNDNVERDSSASPQNDKNGQGLQSENLQKDNVLACENGSNAEVSSQDFSKSGVFENLQGESLKKDKILACDAEAVLKKEFSKSEQDFGDKNGALQGEARELPQRVMTEAKTQQSPFLAQKTSTEEGDIVLDFFAGSGTTAHAVLELNKEDGGKRKFILVTNNEITDLNPNGIAKDVTTKRLKRIMSGECYNGEKNFKWLEKNAPYGGNLEVSQVKDLSAFDEGIFQEIDERLYGLPKFENMHEKIKWVCENFQSTMKKLTMQDKDEAVYEKALKEELERLKNDK